MTDKETMKLALEALKWSKPHEDAIITHGEAITAIKEALAQPEQEPVAWLEPEWGKRICPEIGFEATITSDHPRDLCWIPLYPHPPQRTEQSGWRKVQIDDAEEEAWRELEKKNKTAFKSWFAWYTSPPENWDEKYGAAFVWTAQEKALMQQIKRST